MIKKTYIPAKPRSSKLIGTSMSGGVAGGVSISQVGAIDANSHTHHNKSVIDQLTQADVNVLEKLSLVDGNLRIDANAYSTGDLSAFGLGEEQGGGVIINVIDNLTSTSKTDPLSANMGRHLKTLIDNIEVGEGGQVLVDWEAITGKPTTFAPSAHTHTFASLTSIPTTLAGYGITDGASKVHTHAISDVTNLQTTLNNKLETSVFNTHNNDNVRHITGAERTKWDGVVTDFEGHTHTFASLTSKPTTLSGYGITDATSLSIFNLHANNKANPHGVTKAQIELGNVENLSVAAMFSYANLTEETSIEEAYIDYAYINSASFPNGFDMMYPWKIKVVNSELHFIYNNVVKFRMLSDGSFVAAGGVTAFY